MEPMKPKPGKTINQGAAKLDELNATIDSMMAQRSQVLTEIRESAHDAVVVFVDMVGSSQSKRDHEHEPEVWIYKVRRFYDVVSGYVQQLGGRVIKYIGDEVMAVFDGDTRDNDSANFITRIAEIETSLRKATGEPTSLKVAVDRARCTPLTCPDTMSPTCWGLQSTGAPESASTPSRALFWRHTSTERDAARPISGLRLASWN